MSGGREVPAIDALLNQIDEGRKLLSDAASRCACTDGAEYEEAVEERKKAELQISFAVRDISTLWNHRVVPPAAQEWEGIESAPKDGVELLVWVPRVGFRLAYYVDFNNNDYSSKPTWVDCSTYTSLKGTPTHWRPLPALSALPPLAKEGEV